MWGKVKRFFKQKSEPAKSVPKTSVPGESAAFLERILRTHYGQMSDTEPFVFKLTATEENVQDLAERWRKIPTGSAGIPPSTFKHVDRAGRPRGIQEMLNGGLSLTPGKNVLGKIHNSVMLMVANHDPRFERIPIAIAKDMRLRGRLFYNIDGDMAIVLSMGYFWELYVLNKITHRAFHEEPTDSLDVTWSLLRILLSHLSHFVGKQTARLESLHRPDDSLYRDKDEFLRIHFIANAQQQFVLLHEFGHVAQLLARMPDSKHEMFEWEDDLSRDMDADVWAARHIAESGERFYIPWMQLRSIFWLFEYYHIVEKLEEDGFELTARPRFDAICEVVDPKRTLLAPTYIRDVRWTIDHFLENSETLCGDN